MNAEALTVSEVRAVADAEQAQDVRVQSEHCGPMSSHEAMIFEVQREGVFEQIGETYRACLMLVARATSNPGLADLHGHAVALRKAAEELVRTIELVNR